MQAAAVQLSAGSTAVDTAFYKDGQLALLVSPVQHSSSDSSSAVSLALLPLSGLPFVAVPVEQQAAGILQVTTILE